MYQQGNERWKWIGLICVIGLLGFFFWQHQQEKSGEDWLVSLNESGVQKSGSTAVARDEVAGAYAEPVQPKLAVHIAGAVHKPGVYFLPMGSRIVDLIKLAGGVGKTADLNQINLAQPLVDGQKVVIPLQQVAGAKVVGSGSSGSMAYGGAATISGGGSKKVNINSGSKEELQTLSGVGPSRADSIIQYRTEHGPFRKLEDLMKISGIGEKTFAKLKDQISLY